MASAPTLGYTAQVLQGRHIVVGVSGSVAAYKAVYLARLLVQEHAEVWPVLTASATRFVGALTFSSLCGRRAVTDLWTQAEAGEIGHVELAQRADLVVLAPATADLLARLVHGRAEDPLTAVALATPAPILVAPAMETGMWENAATRDNVARLRERGLRFVLPSDGKLASGRRGVGRMAEPEEVLEAVRAALTPHDLAGHRVVVTAGPTREPFDPVRFISNASSGKMGYALARVARRRGAEVHLISGPSALSAPTDIALTRVETTEQMRDAVLCNLEHATVLIMAAAPADFRPLHTAPTKTKKPASGERLRVELESTPDILLAVKERAPRCLVVGFAAETGAPADKAAAKLEAKSLDMIIANDVTRPDAGFGSDTNAVEILLPTGTRESLPVMSKEALAGEILSRILALTPDRA